MQRKPANDLLTQPVPGYVCLPDPVPLVEPNQSSAGLRVSPRPAECVRRSSPSAHDSCNASYFSADSSPPGARPRRVDALSAPRVRSRRRQARATSSSAGQRGDRVASGSARRSSIVEVDMRIDGVADFSFARSRFTAIDVGLGGGNDTARVDDDGWLFTDTELHDARRGSGNDTVLLGGHGPETLVGGTGADFVDGSLGWTGCGSALGRRHFQWDPGDGSDTIDGGDGADRLRFNASNAGDHRPVGQRQPPPPHPRHRHGHPRHRQPRAGRAPHTRPAPTASMSTTSPAPLSATSRSTSPGRPTPTRVDGPADSVIVEGTGGARQLTSSTPRPTCRDGRWVGGRGHGPPPGRRLRPSRHHDARWRRQHRDIQLSPGNIQLYVEGTPQ